MRRGVAEDYNDYIECYKKVRKKIRGDKRQGYRLRDL